MTKLHTLAALALSLALAACSSSDPQELIAEGHKALTSGDPDVALTKFEAAATGLTPNDPKFIEAKLGVVEALARTEPAKANEEFLSLAKVFPDQVGEKQFVYMSGIMADAGKYIEAIDLAHSGIQRFGGESPKLHLQIERIQKEAANDKGVQDHLRGLGYVN